MDDLDVCLGKVYEMPVGDPSSMWLSKDGRTTSVSEMADAHLINAIKYVRRRYDPAESCVEGDKMSLLSEEFIKSAGTKLAFKFAKCLAHVRSMIDSPRYKHLWAEALKRGLVDAD